MNRALALTCAGMTLAASQPAWADEADASSATAAAGTEIVVVGDRVKYGVKRTSSATKTDTDIKDIPQALSVISSAQIEDQQLRSVGDLLLFVPGASYNSGEGNRDTVVLRGNSSTADFFIDGVRDDVQYFRDFYNIDRVEVLKGPNAMIFGRGGGGGIVNRVLKRPSLTDGRSFTASGDGFGGDRGTGGVDQSLLSNPGGRPHPVFENGGSSRHHADLKRYGINPTVAILAGPATRFDFSYEHFHDRRTADRGVPSLAGKPVEGFTRTFF